MPDTTELHRLLHRHFGFHEFLEGQESVIEAITSGQDTLVIMPTGGGKSLCYQLPAMFLDGITVVVSPLIALMKDQVDGMAEKKIPATFINSSLGQSEMDDRIARMKRGEYRLIYVAPERFKSERFVAALAPLSIALFAIDEAHCISQWGHDFRPDYLRLKWALKDLGQPQVAALTATATPEVRADIIEQLSLGKFGRKPPQVFVSGFARHNLTLALSHTANKAEKLEHIFDTIDELKTGIVYCATRKNVEKVYEELAGKRLSAIYYHGGMTEEQRTKAQDKFMSGRCAVAVATNAFGMGVDRADLRFVTHYDIPGSVEAYYQEAGRAGRDGEPAKCELLFNYADVKTQEFFIDGANPTREIITSLHLTLLRLCKHGPVEMPMSEIAEHVKAAKNDMAVGTALHLLTRAGFIARDYRQGSRTYTTRLVEPVKPLDELALDFERLDAKRQRDFDKLWRMIDYVDCHGCRHGYILNYFGETDAPEHCSACDNCGIGPAPKRRATKRAKTQVAASAPAAPPLDISAKEKTVLLQKALSCVARMNGRFGLGRITLVLVGSRSKEVFDSQLDELSTYGLLKELGYDFTQELLRRLVTAGCIQVTTDEYPKASLSEMGRRVMLAKTQVNIELPPFEKPKPVARKTSSAAAVAAEAEAPYDVALFEALRQWRHDVAGTMGIPAYLVYPDATLKELSRQKPQSEAALLEVRGIGPAKARQFGAETLGIIRGAS
ncbi:MAG: RecQ family ATP-dependent DNA helicase [Verrucomicrobia bacterium]|nr:RecQ family ATP-dependent DNA helicase [Verrucomicrobiota bacterium]